MWSTIVQPVEGAVLIRVKAIPNARHAGVSGPIGDRLKVKVSAPPEDGKANEAICEVIAQRLGVKASTVSVVEGMTSPEKIVRVESMSAQSAIAMLA